MDFRLSSEQEMLKDSARRFVTAELDYEARAKHVIAGSDRWATLAEMGWLMLPISEAYGGLGSKLEDISLICEELGRGVAIEPFVTCGFMPSRLLDLSDAACAGETLPLLASGEVRFAVALYEAATRYDLTGLGTIATASGDGYVLNGRKPLVFGGAEAGQIIVAAASANGEGVALYLVPADAAGVSRRAYRTIDNLPVADIVFDNVALGAGALLAEAGRAEAVLKQAIDETIVLLCMDAVGCMDRAIEMTAEYLHVRQQFGQPLAAFQALQHGVANLFIDANEARSLTYRAMAACAQDDAGERARAVSACKFSVMETARRVTGQAVHFHGGIGITCEYPVGEYLRRMLVAEQIFGNGAYHLHRYLDATN
ncbi:acyl-CoA dehydrogenase domain-containing protein [Sphingobium chlorophenolicum L-1]|uniref:Acyl-CoA dehydrogenase domain-containing protein n=1 Tax=Sphingobium chlorophenolicum L-1 TaxID=690566 RepID=F6F353_SPHCR|nr:acyl-CoA dehydrogenase [Sphingobium chlorophenolicum]AEG50865.1 acyl-CoA dehydrogenase domain-containing protein [Sphingobium chlorophenolicum L-1]